MRTVWAMAIKDLLLLWRDRFGVFWVLVFPLMFALLFGSIFSGGGGGGGGNAMRVIVVDLDNSDASRALAQNLDNSDAVAVTSERDGVVFDEVSAREAVRVPGEVSYLAYVVIPEGYADTRPAFIPGGDAATLRVGIDPARQAEAGFLQGVLIEATMQESMTRLQDPAFTNEIIDESLATLEAADNVDPATDFALRAFLGAARSLAGTFQVPGETADTEDAPTDGIGQSFQPVNIETEAVTRDTTGRPISAFEVSFPQGMLWGLLGCVAGFSVSLVKERTDGTYLRLRVAPQTRAHIIAGKALACFLTCLLVIATLTLVAVMFFGVRITSPAGLATGVFATSWCFTGLMMFISTLGRTERAVGGAGWAALMPLAIIGGGTVPLFFMPDWLRSLASISPMKWAILALEGGIWRAFGPADFALPVTVLLGVGVLGFALAVMMLKRVEI
ncbi:MAG: ABC transporter permease [Planctomycetota bacterium]